MFNLIFLFMKRFNWLFYILFAFAFIACDDEEEDILDTEAPEILWTLPVEGSEAEVEDDGDFVVRVEADVTDNVGLEEVTIGVTAPGGQLQVVHTENVSDFLNDSREADIEETISLGDASLTPGNYLITITATDESGNQEEQSRIISVMEQAPAEAITIEGIEEGQTLETLGSTAGVPTTFRFQGEEGIDSVNVSARNIEDDREIFNQGFNQAFFDENNIDNTGDFSFQEDLRFPNTSLVRGATDLTVRTFRGGTMVDETTVNTNLEPVANATEIPFNATPAADLPEGTRLFASGNFTADDEFSDINDPGFELLEDAENPGTFGTTIFADPNEPRSVNFRFSMMDTEGNSAFEVDENCLEVAEDFRTFDTGIDASVDVGNINFSGFGDCL